MKNIDEYGEFTERMWLGPKDSPLTDEVSLSIMTLGLGGEAGEVVQEFLNFAAKAGKAQERIKKFIRDGNLDSSEMKKELGDVVYYWARICKHFGMLPSEVLAANVEKLEARRLRGTMRGSGDNR